MSGMLKMLRRLIGEDIDLAWMPGAELWPIKIDPGQIESGSGEPVRQRP